MGKKRRPAKYVHVLSAVIRANVRRTRKSPPICSRATKSAPSRVTKREPIYDKDGRVVAAVVYKPHSPLRCGASTYVECYCPDPAPKAATAAQSTRRRGSSTGKTS